MFSLAFVNDSYFNIADGHNIGGTTVQLHTGIKQDVDDAKIPTGTSSPHPDIRLFTASTPLAIYLGETAPAFDHCFILPDNPDIENLPESSRTCLELSAGARPDGVAG